MLRISVVLRECKFYVNSVVLGRLGTWRPGRIPGS